MVAMLSGRLIAGAGTCSGYGGTVRVLALVALLGPGVNGFARAQAWVPAAGSGTVQAAFRREVAKNHLDYEGNPFSPGEMTAQSLYLTLDYGITDKLAVTAVLPYITKRYVGGAPHRPDLLGADDDHHVEQLDNGDYHGGWQDFGLKVRYNLRTDPVMITPYVALNVPTNSYVFFAHSAIGTRQWSVQFGVDVGRVFEPPFQNLYVQLGYGYSIVEQMHGVGVNRSNVTFELGYLFTPAITARLLLLAQKTHGGYDLLVDFPSRSDDRFFHHDQNTRVDYFLGGAGVDYRIGELWAVSGTWGKTLWGENAHEVHHIVSVTLTRSF